MASNTPDSKPKKAPRIHRFAIGMNVLIQIIAVFFILAFVNYYSFKHFKRWDLSRNQKYALSDQTKRLLESLTKPVDIKVFFSPDPRLPGGDFYTDIQALLKEYQYAAPTGKIDVELVDPYKNLSRAKELMTKYKFGNENVIVVDYQGHSKLINATDMADYDTSGEMEGQPPTLKAFKGEQALTGAILETTEEKQSHVYLIGEKGGPELASDDLAVLKTYMERQNLKVDSINLMNSEKIPDDAKVLMLIGARYDLTDRELKLLHDYWDKQGRIFIALDPTANTPKLDGFVREMGINPQDDRVLRTMNLGFATGIQREPTAVFSETSPVTKRLKGVGTTFFGQTQSLALTQPNGIHTEPLATADEGFWGETSYKDIDTGAGVTYDPKQDISAPLTLAASAEKGALPDASVNVETSRLIVVGNSVAFTSPALSQAQENLDFSMASLNWTLNHEELIGIAPKDEEQFSLNLSDQQIFRTWLVVVVLMPAAALAIGLGVWAKRRR